MRWLPEPPAGTKVTLGFDGSENNDHSAIRAHTIDGVLFTPRYGPDDRPTIWDPAQWGDQIPRGEVHAAVDELFSRFDVRRMYCDPQDWRSEIGDWALEFGQEKVVEWATNRTGQMYDAIRRFETDLTTGRIRHDGCPITAVHMANCRKVAKPGQKYILGKPADHQKIDAAMASILAHEAAQDAHADGWADEVDSRVIVFR